MISQIIAAKLAADINVYGSLNYYEFDGVTPTPAIFSRPTFPPDKRFPAIIINEPGSSGDFGSVAKRGGETYATVRLYGNKQGPASVLAAIAQSIWKCLNRASVNSALSVYGYEEWGFIADPPQQIDDPDGFPGWLINVKARYLEIGT